MTRPDVTGLLETCLYVDDIGRSRAFYGRVFAFETLTADDRIVAYDLAPGQVLILFQKGATDRPVHVGGGIIPAHDGEGRMHFALAISAASLDRWKTHLSASEVTIEGEVAWPKGGTSLYFRDPDGHLIELATPGLWKNY